MTWAWLVPIVVSLAALAAIQATLVFAFVRAVARAAGESQRADALARTSVLLCVRGIDPSLRGCVRALLDQDHPDYELIVVADHADDPALAALRNWYAAELGAGRWRWIALDEIDRLEHCSLKCSALVKACQDLDPTAQVTVMVDADTRPERTWLRRLTAPLQRRDVGAVTATRWYEPDDLRWGTLVRFVWNAAAIVQMWWYGIPWGGSLAFRREVLSEVGLVDLWRSTLCEDTASAAPLRRAGYRVAWVADLVLENRESCRWQDLLPWIRRELLTARLHHPAWIAVLGHATGTTLALGAAIVSIPVAAALGRWDLAGAFAAASLLYEAAMVGLAAAIAHAVRRRRVATDTAPAAIPAWRFLGAILASQVVYPMAAWGAVAIRQISWRKVQYRIQRRPRIRRIDYAPYLADPESASSESL